MRETAPLILSLVLVVFLLPGCQTGAQRQIVIDFSQWQQMTPEERDRACDLMRERLAQLRMEERTRQSRRDDIVCTQGGCFSRPGPLLEEPFGPEAGEMNRLADAIEEHCQ